MERRLAAILAADVVGYSSLMERDEEGTYAAFRERLRTLIEPALQAHGGHIVKRTGDGLLAELSSIVDAVKCAVEIQRRNEDQNLALTGDRRIRLRLGINIGDVIIEDGDIYGNGVNIAARLESLAPPGGIYISGAAVAQAQERSGISFRYLGHQQLRNISEPVAVYEVDQERAGDASLSAIVALPQAGERPSVAILPFKNLGSKRKADYFSDGITRDLITELSRFRSLFVIAAESSFRFRGAQKNRRAIGRELGVRYLGDGTVQRVGRKLRVTAELVDAHTGVEVWADRYSHDARDPAGMQDWLAQNLASRLHSSLQFAELDLIKRKPPSGLKSYDLWLQGTDCHESNDPDGYARARVLYKRAIEADQGFARAYASLAELVYMESVLSNWGREDKDDVAEAESYAKTALALDYQEANAHAVTAWVHMVRREFLKAARHWELAAALNPNDADIMMWRASALAFLGQPEKGIEAAQLAMRLNPLHPDWYLNDYAVVLFFAHRYEEMLSVFEVIPELFPHTPGWRAAAYAHLGRMAEARDRAVRFERNIAAIWSGSPNATAKDYGRWLMRCIPLARPREQETMREGLRKSGLLD
ncbi:MAG TPA: adenylate/guanylate cyclase domain-containing protein [Aestuariivirgaceae bacterium]|jgi:class 3 adenylate cyclase/TolB-like protein